MIHKLLSLGFVLLINFAFQAQDCNNVFVVLSADGEWIYFSSDRHAPGSNYEIYRSSPDGISNLQRLTNTSNNNFFPKVNGAGTKLVWQSGDYGSDAEVWIMDVDGANQLRLTENSVHDGYPNFSPDGQKIVFEAWDNDIYPEIFMMDVDGSNRLQLTNFSGAYWQSAPMFNPTGSAIYFFKGFNADNHIAKMNLDGSDPIDITPSNSFGYSEAGLSFSPDGSKIAFSTTDNVGYNNGSDIVIADTTGENWTFITSSSNGQYFYFPSWHPDGTKIYYSYNSTGNAKWSIYHMSPDGNAPTQISDCNPVGLAELQQTVIKVYPNPVVDLIYIDFDDAIRSMIYDMQGRLVESSSGNRLDVSSFTKGIYLLIVENERGEVICRSKIVKQ